MAFTQSTVRKVPIMDSEVQLRMEKHGRRLLVYLTYFQANLSPRTINGDDPWKTRSKEVAFDL